jgi:4-hydroxy-2-oxoheptanedioate aldolase
MQTGLKDKIASGKPSIGASIAMASPDLVDFCGFLGFEWIIMDAESGPIRPSECLAICRVCEAHGMVPIVKVPRPDPEVIQAYLCTGARGIMVPHVNTAEVAQKVVDAARYPPEGRRGHDMGSRSSGYAPAAIDAEYLARSNRELLVGVLIENETGMANLEAILEIPGIDALYIGPGDLAISMGYQDRDHPVVQQMIAEGRQKILASGKALFGGAADASTAKQMIEQGALLIHTRVTEMWGNITKNYLREVRGDTATDPDYL